MYAILGREVGELHVLKKGEEFRYVFERNRHCFQDGK